VEVSQQQRERLQRTIEWAHRIRAELRPLLDAHGGRVHFRPSSTGVAMVGLLPDRPQRGKSGLTNLKALADGFEATFDAHCRTVEQGRVTGEKALQSFLISEAQTNGRRLASLNRASAATNDPVELWFVTDEIALPVEGGKMVCDVLALRRDGGRCTPVLIELKDSRQLTRLVEQVEGYARLIEEHADQFAELFSALLGEDIRFDGPTEKWIVWPTAGASADPRTQELLDVGIRVTRYAVDGERYSFVVGPGANSPTNIPAAETRVAATDDRRITNLRRVGAGEGFATYTGLFEGKAAFIADCGTLNDIMDEEDRYDDSVTVRVFESEAARDRFVEQLRRASPAALGMSETEDGWHAT
jgi:hypothetical protein